MESGYGLRHKSISSVASCLIITVFLSTFAPYIVIGQDAGNGTTLQTDYDKYAAGEKVIFSGSGFTPGGSSYQINISCDPDIENESIYQVASFQFTSTDSGDVPSGLSWAIPFDAENGTYYADAYNITDPDNPTTYKNLVASVNFRVETNSTQRISALGDKLAGLEELVLLNVNVMGINNSLLKSLNNTERKLEAAAMLLLEGKNKTAVNQLRAARNMLTAFIHKVIAQSGKKIDEQTAIALVEEANATIIYIDSMIVSTLIPTGKQLALNVQRALAKQESNLARFLIRKGLAEAKTDEEYLELANSTEAEIQGILNRIREKNRIKEELWANRTIDFVTLLMELQRNNETATNVRAAAELLLSELEAQNQTRPGLGKKLGHLMSVARGILTNSTETSRGMGQLISKAKSQVHQEMQHGQGAGKGNDENGDKWNNGNKGNNKGNKWNNGNHGNLGRRR